MFYLYLNSSWTLVSLKVETHFTGNGLSDNCRMFSMKPSSCMSMTMFWIYGIFWKFCSSKSGDSTDKLKRKTVTLWLKPCLSSQSCILWGFMWGFFWISCQQLVLLSTEPYTKVQLPRNISLNFCVKFRCEGIST